MHLFLLHVLVCFNFSEKSFWPQYMYLILSPNNGFRWCPLGKLSHLGLEQLLCNFNAWYKDIKWINFFRWRSYTFVFLNFRKPVWIPNMCKIEKNFSLPSADRMRIVFWKSYHTKHWIIVSVSIYNFNYDKSSFSKRVRRGMINFGRMKQNRHLSSIAYTFAMEQRRRFYFILPNIDHSTSALFW